MTYAEVPPRPELAPWVAAGWRFRVARDAGELDHTVPPTGGAMLFVPRGGPALVTGPWCEPLVTRVEGGYAVAGVHFWPGAAGAFLGVDLEPLRQRTVPAAELLPPGDAERLAVFTPGLDEEEAGRRLEEELVRRLPPPRPLDVEVMEAVFRILASRGREPVGRLAGEVGLSRRHFRRRFRRATALSPKELARVRRLRASAVDSVLGDPRWVEVALDHGYADQAHLVREFRSLLGTTPTGFQRHAGRIDHRSLLRGPRRAGPGGEAEKSKTGDEPGA